MMSDSMYPGITAFSDATHLLFPQMLYVMYPLPTPFSLHQFINAPIYVFLLSQGWYRAERLM
jgi:hypothetical protein